MSQRQYDLVAIGEVLIDLISDEMVFGLNEAEGFRRFLGGEVSNVAWNVSALGGRTAVVACIGDDGFGDYLRQQMESAGVCVDSLRVTCDAPTTVAVNARQTETPDFIIYRGADAHISLDGADLEMIKDSRTVHTSAFALSREPARSTILQVLESARENGCLTSLDPNYHPRIWPDVADFHGVLEEAYGWVDITKPSLDDCSRLLGEGQAPVDCVEYFLSLGPQIVALTMGPDGVLLGLAINSLIAYALARLEFRGRGAILSVIVALIIVPFQAVAVPLLLMVNNLPWFDGSTSWLDTYHVQIIPFIADAFSIYLFYQFFIGFPKELEEAALVDGASLFRIFWNIVLPLSRPVFATVAILQFLTHWGDFLWPLMVTRGERVRPLTIGMQSFFGQDPRLWGDLMAFAAMITVPVLIVFLMFQKWFVQSVATSGIKGGA